MLHKTVSLADQIFERLESDILSGKYPRGSILTELSLSEDLSVSRTPIREAIRRLEQEHLVETTAKGAMVLSITKDDAFIIYDLRIQIEGLAARACALHATDEQIQELKELVELQEFYTQKEDSEKVKSTDSQFHQKIYEFAGSPVYADTLTPLHNKLQKYRKVAVSRQSMAVISNAEHREIYEAIAAHNPDKAELTMKTHVQKAKMRLSETNLKEN